MRSKHLLSFSLILSLLFGFIAANGQTMTINVTPSDTLCAGNTAHFHSTTSVPGFYGRIWMVNSAATTATGPNYNTAALANGDTVWCVLTNAAGDTVLDTSNYIIMTIIPAVVPSLIAGPDSVCLGSSITVMDSVAGGTWHSSNNGIFTVDTAGVITPVAPGMARVVYMITTGSCVDSVRLRIRVNVPAGPIMATSTTICQDSTFFLRDTARGGQWTVADTTITSLVAPFGLFQAYIPGTTTIYYSVANACGSYLDSIAITVIDCSITGVSEVTPAQEAAVSIFPNPSNGTFSIAYNTTGQDVATITINDLLGKQVGQISLAPNRTYNWNTGIAPGLYMITTRSGDHTITEKLIINR